MAAHEINTRFKLEGEQEYKKAMTDAANAIKVLNSEQKLAAAEFENTGDRQQYAATQARILKEQIANQQKAVEAAETAVKKLTDNGVDPSSKAMQTWKTKLNNARTAMFSMQTRLQSVEGELGDQKNAFDNAETAGGEYQNQLEKIGKGFDINNTITAIDNITDKIANAAKAAARAAKAIWDLGADAGDWADELLTASAETGVDVETLQSWRYASRIIDTSVDDMSKAWRDLGNKMSEGNVELLGTMAEMGIASMNTDGTMRDSIDVFWDTIDALHSIENPMERASVASKLFGNEWTKLNPLIEAGSEAYKELAEEGRESAVVDEEKVQALGAMDDQMEKTQAAFDKLKYDALAAMAPTFEKIAAAMETAITSLDKFLESAEGQEMLASLNESLSGIIDAFIGENGEGFSKLVDTAKGALSGLNDALKWIADNKDGLVVAIEAIATAFAALKISSTVLEFVKLAQGAKGLFGGGGDGGSITPIVQNLTDNNKNDNDDLLPDLLPVTNPKSLFDRVKDLFTKNGSTISNVLMNPWTWTAALAAAILIPEFKAINDFENNPELMAEHFGQGHSWSDKVEGSDTTYADKMASLIVDGILLNEAGQSYTDEWIQGVNDTWGYANGSFGHAIILNDLENDIYDAFGYWGGQGTGLEGLKEYFTQSFGPEFTEMIMPMVERQYAEAKEKQDRQDFANAVNEQLNDRMTPFIDLAERWQRAQEQAQAKEEGLPNAIAQAIAEAGQNGGFVSDETIAALGEQLTTAGILKSPHEILNYINDSFGENGNFSLDMLKANILEDYEGNIADMLIELFTSATTGVTGIEELAQAVGENVADGMAEGIEAEASTAEEASTALANSVIDAATSALDEHSPSKVFDTIGRNAAIGLANGIYAGGNSAIIAALWLARSVENIVRSALQIHSPSAVFDDLGNFVGEGFAEGIEGSADNVSRAVDKMVSATMRRPVMSIGGYSVSPVTGARAGSGAGAAGAADMVNVTLVLDEEVLGSVMAPIVNDRIGAKIQATRR